jgi:hypothetical protein
MTASTRRSAKSGTLVTEAPAPRKPKYPTIEVEGKMVPNVVELRSTMKWADIVALVGNSSGLHGKALVDLSYKIEPLVDPTLKFEATGKSVEAARKAGVRWERIVARTGVSESKVRKMFEDETGMSSDTSYVKKGRLFDPMKGGLKPVGYKDALVLDPESGTWVPKDGAAKRPARRAKKNGSAPVAAPTTTPTTEAPAKRAPRRAKTA